MCKVWGKYPAILSEGLGFEVYFLIDDEGYKEVMSKVTKR